MAKNDLVRYLVPVTFPDGVRLVGGFTSPDPKISIPQIRAALEQNPDVQFNPEDIRFNVSEDDIKKSIEDWRAANPERAAAADLGLDTPNRLLTDPEISRNLAAQAGPGGEPKMPPAGGRRGRR